MARTQAINYDERRNAVVESAAALFAANGYEESSVAGLAEASNLSKSLIYHYFESKEEILYEVMTSHMRSLLETIDAVEGQTPEARFFDLTLRLLMVYRTATNHQKVLVNDLDKLSPSRRQEIVKAERDLITFTERLLSDVSSIFRESVVISRATVMLYFGMINWTHTWFNQAGSLDAQTLSRVVADLFLNGALHAVRIHHNRRAPS